MRVPYQSTAPGGDHIDPGSGCSESDSFAVRGPAGPRGVCRRERYNLSRPKVYSRIYGCNPTKRLYEPTLLANQAMR